MWRAPVTGGRCGSRSPGTLGSSGRTERTGSPRSCRSESELAWLSVRAARRIWWSSLAVKDWTCSVCGSEDGGWLIMEDSGPVCMSCADMGHLVFLPSGDAALTRRAKAASRLSAVVVRFSRSRGRYERQGILVEEGALERAEVECLADEDARARRRERDALRRVDEDVELQARMAQEIARLFPGCPADRALAIASRAAVRGSGRVGRSEGGRALESEAIELAVAAAVRHQDTRYDELLMSGLERGQARAGCERTSHVCSTVGGGHDRIKMDADLTARSRGERTRAVAWSYWDLWFCVVAVADHDGDLDALAAAIEDGGRSFWSGGCFTATKPGRSPRSTARSPITPNASCSRSQTSCADTACATRQTRRSRRSSHTCTSPSAA